MPTTSSIMLDTAAVERALKRISHEIIERNQGCDTVCLVGVCRRGVPLACRLSEYIFQMEGKRVPVGSLDITRYRDDIGQIEEMPVLNATDIPFDINGRDVVLVDDVLFTGRTARAAMDALIEIGRPATVQLAVLIDRGHRELPIRGDYIGKNIPTSRTEQIAVCVPEYDGTTAVVLYRKDEM